MIKALVAEKYDISLYAYIDEPTNLVKYYIVHNYLARDYTFMKFYSYTKAKNYYNKLIKNFADRCKVLEQEVLAMVLKGQNNDSK